MDMQDRQYIGILASTEEADRRDNVFINKPELFTPTFSIMEKPPACYIFNLLIFSPDK